MIVDALSDMVAMPSEAIQPQTIADEFYMDPKKGTVSRRWVLGWGAAFFISGASTGRLLFNSLNYLNSVSAVDLQPSIPDLLRLAQSQPYPFELISVLGAGLKVVDGEFVPDENGLTRLITADFLRRMRVGRKLLLQGGSDSIKDSPPEADILFNTLKGMYTQEGWDNTYLDDVVDKDRISDNTDYNIQVLKDYIGSRGIKKVLEVTTGNHRYGVGFLAHEQGLGYSVYDGFSIAKSMSGDPLEKYLPENKTTGNNDHEDERAISLIVDPHNRFDRTLRALGLHNLRQDARNALDFAYHLIRS